MAGGTYIIKECDFTGSLGGYSPDEYIIPKDTFIFDTTGIRVRKKGTTGVLRIPFEVTLAKEIIGGILLYSGNIKWLVYSKKSDKDLIYDRLTDTWVEADEQDWMDGKEFYLISKFNEGEFSVVLLFDDSTTLVGIKILFGVGIVDYSYLIHKKIEEFITGMTFTGRLTCSLVSTEEVSQNVYGIPKEEVTPAVGYVFDKYVSVIDTTSLEELFVEETGTHIIVNKPLDNATINVYFNYRCNIKINQGLDFVEIEKTPALVVDDYVLNQSISLPDMIQVFGYAGITEDKKDIIKGYSCEAQRGVSLDFNLIIASTLFYDTLVIWDTLYSNSFCNIPLPEVGGHILVEMVSPSRETTPILTEGGRVLYKRVSLKFPYPIKVTEGKVVNSLNIKLNSLGGYNG